MTEPSSSHLVLIPSYNTGDVLFETVRDARRVWAPVWVVIDGSTDGTGTQLGALHRHDPHLRVLQLARNGGKGAAVSAGLREAGAVGFSHVLVMDADGQHPAQAIPLLMARSMAQPEALVLGVPIFDASAPALRVRGRKISNWWANLETLWAGIGDSLFGFRVYPTGALRAVMDGNPWMQGFDFDPEAAVRLAWTRVPLINVPVPVRYLSQEEGGVSHFRYGRDNALLTWMHVRLMSGFLRRLPVLAWRRAWRRLRPSHH